MTRTGHITKQGRKELRYALVEAAWRKEAGMVICPLRRGRTNLVYRTVCIFDSA